MNKLTKGMIIGLVIGLILGGIAGYILHNNINRNFIQGRGSFQINEAQINEVTSFFESTSDINELRTYCENNRANCFYYCRNINPSHEICKEIINSSGMPGGRM